jgi:ABC-type Fe3+ transport system substrate-binding protein
MIRISVSLLSVLLFANPAVSADPAQNQQKTLAIITSFSPQFYVPFIAKFRELRPDIKVQVLNKKTTAAIDEIIRGNERRFDLFWSSSPDAFVVLKQAGRLRYLDYIAHYPPISPTQPYFDEQGWFYNFALSGVGFMWNRATLDEGGIGPPRSWQDLTHPRFYGQLAMSTPSRSGTNHLIVESILQDMGWEKGWTYLMTIAGNMKTITARSFSVPDGVAGGRFGAGLMIDFLAHAKIHLDPVNQFEYGDPTYVMPARIAALQDGRNVEAAVAFIDFLLSVDGQKVLLQPEINRLPVSREPFVGHQEAALPLINLIRREKTRSYDTGLSTVRYSLVNVLFDELITYRLLERKRLWKKLIDLAKSNHSDPEEMERLKRQVIDEVSKMPVTDRQSLDPEINELFTSASLSAEQRQQKRNLLDDWEHFVTRQLQTADKLIVRRETDTNPPLR